MWAGGLGQARGLPVDERRRVLWPGADNRDNHICQNTTDDPGALTDWLLLADRAVASLADRLTASCLFIVAGGGAGDDSTCHCTKCG